MKKEFIPVCEPLLGDTEREYLIDAFDSGWISAGGKYNQKLEDEFSKYCGVEYGSTVSNGTVALHLAIKALGLADGDEVIVPNFNGIYGPFSLFYEGIVPVAVDAEVGTWNINPDLIEEKISIKTKAIMIVHLYGHPCDYEKIKRIAEKHNLYIIEDAAEAHGAEYKGKKTGSLGDISTFSFYSNKVMSSGEGGIVLTNDSDYHDKVEYYKNQCFPLNGPRHFIHEDVGFNYRLTNLQAAIAYAQFEKLEKLVDSRILVNKSYREMLSGIEGISFQHEKEYAKNIYWMTGILVNQEKTGFSRNQLEEHLAKNDIQTRRFFVGMNRQPVFQKKNIQVVGEFPISDMLSDNGLYLPSSSQLRDSDIERITQTIKELL